MNLGILDYGAGNLRSVRNAFKAVDQPATFVSAPEHFDALDVLVFPGQGAFGDCVRQLQEAGLWAPLKQWLAEERPYFGICLGYQLLFESGEESPGVEGLGKFEGVVTRFPEQAGLKVPHMGWNQAKFTDPAHPAWEGMGVEETFYFVHSYYPVPQDNSLTACVTDYAGDFVSGIAARNLVAVQFHPEKSQQAGLKLLRNSLAWLGSGSGVEV